MATDTKTRPAAKPAIASATTTTSLRPKRSYAKRPTTQVGELVMNENGDYQGIYTTMSQQAAIIVYKNPQKRKDTHPDYLVETSTGFQLGKGYINTGEESGEDYIRLCVSAPEIGGQPVYCNIAPAPNKKPDHFVLLWNG